MYGDLFNVDEASLLEWIYASCDSKALECIPSISGPLLRMLAGSLSRNKTCAEDMIVVEMLQELDEDFFDLLARVFQLRLLNHSSERADTTWSMNVITLIAKKAKATLVKDFRPITVLPMLYRLYSKFM